MSTEHKPLLIEQLAYITRMSGTVTLVSRANLEAFIASAKELEADRTKLLAALQVCADALRTCDVFDPDYDQITNALSQLKYLGIEPSNK